MGSDPGWLNCSKGDGEMMKWILLLLLGLTMGQTCEPAPPPPPMPGYCPGAETPAYIVEGNIAAAYSTIIGGTPSVDRRSTFWLYMPGKGSCTAVALGPRVALTAAHCRGPNDHRLYPDRLVGEYYTATSYLVHPEYTKYLGSGNVYTEGRKADLMLLYFDVDLPGPFPTGIYESNQECASLTAQGWGQTEDDPKHPCPVGTTRCLREGPYTVVEEEEKQLRTKHALLDPIAICFGDSGGPLYAGYNDGRIEVAGITSTTATSDCLYSSRHTKVSYFEDWIDANLEP